MRCSSGRVRRRLAGAALPRARGPVPRRRARQAGPAAARRAVLRAAARAAAQDTRAAGRWGLGAGATRARHLSR